DPVRRDPDAMIGIGNSLAGRLDDIAFRSLGDLAGADFAAVLVRAAFEGMAPAGLCIMCTGGRHEQRGEDDEWFDRFHGGLSLGPRASACERLTAPGRSLPSPPFARRNERS